MKGGWRDKDTFFSNAFNSPEREAMAEHAGLFTHLAPLFSLEYRKAGDFYIRDVKGKAPFQSERGSRQGSTLGPTFFCLAIQPMLEHVDKNIEGCTIQGYMDDITLMCASPEAAEKAFTYIEQEALKMSVVLNRKKCEVLTASPDALNGKLHGVARVDALKLLGAAVGITADKEKVLLEKMYKGRFVDFFRRLRRVHGPAGMCILTAAGIPKLSHLIRTHEPAVVKDVALAFDDQTLDVWQSWALIEADSVSRALAALPVKRGGLGLTPQVEIMAGAYMASRDSALGTSVDGIAMSQKLRTAEKMCELERFVDEADPACKRHREHNTLPHTASAFRIPHLRANLTNWSAALRWRLFAPIAGMPALATCATCNKSVGSKRDWMRHAASCTHATGNNSASRHAAIKVAIKQMLHENRVAFNSAEPRHVRRSECDCGLLIAPNEFAEHVKTCAKAIANAHSPTSRRGCGHGPDILVYLSDGDGIDAICIDVTVTSAETDKHKNAELAKLFDGVRKSKHALYDELIPAGQKLIVTGFSESGAPCSSTTKLVKQVATYAGEEHFEMLKRLCAEALLAHGGALANAERLAGVSVDHRIWRPPAGEIRLLEMTADAIQRVSLVPDAARPGAAAATPASVMPVSAFVRNLTTPTFAPARSTSPPRPSSATAPIAEVRAGADAATATATATEATAAPAVADAATSAPLPQAQPQSQDQQDAARLSSGTMVVHNHYYNGAPNQQHQPQQQQQQQPQWVSTYNPQASGIYRGRNVEELQAITSPGRTRIFVQDKIEFVTPPALRARGVPTVKQFADSLSDPDSLPEHDLLHMIVFLLLHMESKNRAVSTTGWTPITLLPLLREAEDLRITKGRRAAVARDDPHVAQRMVLGFTFILWAFNVLELTTGVMSPTKLAEFEVFLSKHIAPPTTNTNASAQNSQLLLENKQSNGGGDGAVSADGNEHPTGGARGGGGGGGGRGADGSEE